MEMGKPGVEQTTKVKAGKAVQENSAKFVFLNTQCIRSKYNLLDIFVVNELPAFLCLSEHWMTELEGHSYQSIHNLKLAAAYFRSIHKNGGTAIYSRPDLRVQVIDVTAYCCERDLELSAVEWVDQGIIIVALYHSPNGNFENFLRLLEDCLVFLVKSKKKIVLGGDFNRCFACDTDDRGSLENLLRSAGCYVTTREPTRGNSSLDTVATNMDVWEYSVKVVDPLVADHSAVVFEVKTSRVSNINLSWQRSYIFTSRPIKVEKIDLLKAKLECVNWGSFVNWEGTAVVKFENFFIKLQELFDDLFPAKEFAKVNDCGKANKNNLPYADKSWFTSELKQIRCLVISLNDQAKGSTSQEDKVKWHKRYMEAKRCYRKKVDLAKKNHNADLIMLAHNPCKAAWKLVNGNRRKVQVSNENSSPDDYNGFFIESVSNIVKSIPDVDGSPLDGLVLNSDSRLSNWTPVTHHEIVDIVNRFQSSTSPDIYGMTIDLLKQIIDPIACPLAKLINQCLVEGTFPDFLKNARTIPIYKKGSPDSPESFRPISVLPVLAKIFEVVLRDQIVNYFEVNNFFSTAQHGFRRGRSTATALMALSSRIQSAFENKKSVALVLCDLSKAFDVISHEILLQKLSAYGFTDKAWEMMCSYLSNRVQTVVVGGASSAPREVSHGVPQGSVLGPLLFLIVINDLRLHGSTLLFADDTTLVAEGETGELAVEEAELLLQKAKEWFALNKLQLNVSKTQHLLCSLGHNQPPDNNEAKLLGFVLDAKLSWKGHIDHVCTKLSRVIFLLRRLKSQLTDRFLVTVYHSLFHSHLLYGILLWGHVSNTSKILLIQKKAIRILTSAPFGEHCRPLFKRLGILTVINQYIYNSLLYIKQNFGFFEVRNELHGKNLRSGSDLNYERCRLRRTQESFPHQAIRLFNCLPTELRNYSEAAFKGQVHRFLAENPFYRLSEYYECTGDWAGGARRLVLL